MVIALEWRKIRIIVCYLNTQLVCVSLILSVQDAKQFTSASLLTKNILSIWEIILYMDRLVKLNARLIDQIALYVRLRGIFIILESI